MILKEDADGVRVLRLAHPPSNVLTLGLLQTLRGEIEAAGADGSVRCLMIASSYPRYFSSGLDLEELMSLPKDRRSEPFVRLLETYRLLRELPKPTLACIGGSAILGGWILAMGCDMRFLSLSGKIALSEVRFGLSPTRILVQRLLEISSSPSLAKEMALRGRTLRAEEALAGGFVDRLVADAEVYDESLREARSLSRQAPAAYASVKRALGHASMDEALWSESLAEFNEIFDSPEALEGVSALREKRRPRFEPA